MEPTYRLSPAEADALARIRERLGLEGLRLSDDRFLVALLRAAADLPAPDLLKLVEEGLRGSGDCPDPPPG